MSVASHHVILLIGVLCLVNM